MTGITEVQLPIDVRLKNIEDTETAKKLLLEATGGKWYSSWQLLRLPLFYLRLLQARELHLLYGFGEHCAFTSVSPSTIEETEEEAPLTFKEIFEPKRSMFASLFGAKRKRSTSAKGATDDIVAKRFIRGEKSRWKRGR